MAVNKVICGSNTVIDLTKDTVTPEGLVYGRTAHDKSGKIIEGALTPVNITDVEENTMFLVFDFTSNTKKEAKALHFDFKNTGTTAGVLDVYWGTGNFTKVKIYGNTTTQHGVDHEFKSDKIVISRLRTSIPINVIDFWTSSANGVGSALDYLVAAYVGMRTPSVSTLFAECNNIKTIFLLHSLLKDGGIVL